MQVINFKLPMDLNRNDQAVSEVIVVVLQNLQTPSKAKQLKMTIYDAIQFKNIQVTIFYGNCDYYIK